MGAPELDQARVAPDGGPYLSVSQVETAYGVEDKGTKKEKLTGCQHKWELRYLAREKMPQESGAELGSRVHTIAEDWLTEGKASSEAERLTLLRNKWDPVARKKFKLPVTYQPWQIFAPGLLMLPPPRTVKVEGKFWFSTNVHGGAPVWWTGTKDMEWTAPDGLLWIGDHKTALSWSYQKSDAILRKDWQANLYALEAMQRLKVRKVGLAWFTYLTDPEKARECRAVRLEVEYDAVRAVVAELEARGRDLLLRYRLHRESGRLPGLPKNRVACSAFGGCKYDEGEGTGACKRQLDDLNDLFGGVKVSNQYDSFLADVDAHVPGAAQASIPAPVAVPPPVVAAPPPPVPVAVPTPAARPAYWIPGDPMNEVQEYMKAGGAPLSAVANAADVPPPPEVAKTYNERPPVERGFINPQEAPAVAPIAQHELPAPPVAVQATAPVVPPDDLDALERDALKALGVQMGLWGAAERRQALSLRTAIRDARKTGATFPVAAPAPVPVFVATPVFDPPAAQAAFEQAMGQAPVHVAAPVAAPAAPAPVAAPAPAPVVLPPAPSAVDPIAAVAASLPPTVHGDVTRPSTLTTIAVGMAADPTAALEAFVSTLTPAQLGKLLKLAGKALGAQVTLKYEDS